jgi:hypothetical protein
MSMTTFDERIPRRLGLLRVPGPLPIHPTQEKVQNGGSTLGRQPNIDDRVRTLD